MKNPISVIKRNLNSTNNFYVVVMLESKSGNIAGIDGASIRNVYDDGIEYETQGHIEKIEAQRIVTIVPKLNKKI